MVKAAAACVVLSVLLLGGYMLHNRTDFGDVETIGQYSRGFDDLRSRFVDLARRVGAPYAYTVLARAKLPSGTDLHLLGHAVGDVLYQQKGIAGMILCTPEFRNACSHSIVINALYEFGDGALQKIHDACMQAPGGTGAYTMCFHGLGHGVFTYFKQDLAKTVEFCRRVGTPEHHNREYTECVGGAIMELVDPGAGIGGDEVALDRARAKYLLDPLAPCMSPVMPDDAKSICLTYLTPRLWIQAGIDMSRPDSSKFTKAFSYCNAIPAGRKNLREICYAGFGKEFLTLAASRDVRHVDQQPDESLRKIGTWCSYAKSLDGENACVGDAVAGLFWGGENDPNGAFRFCSTLQTTAKEACFNRLVGEIRNYTNGDKKNMLCARLPSAEQMACRGTP